MGVRKRRYLTVLALTVGLVGALLVTTSGAFGQVDGPVAVERGVLLLHTGDDANWIRYYPDPSSNFDESGNFRLNNFAAEQLLEVNSRCGVTPMGDDLLTITTEGGSFGLGLVSNGLGVKDRNNCSTSQGLIDLDQSMTLTLGSYFESGFWIRTGETDIEGKHSSNLMATFESDAPRVIILPNTDNGPDSGVNDNNIAELVRGAGAYYRTVKLQSENGNATGGAISLEGGGDGVLPTSPLRGALGVNETLFEVVELFDGELDCGDTVSAGGLPEDAEITILRGGQLNCILKLHRLSSEGASALFEPIGPPSDPLTGEPAEFTATIAWPTELRGNVGDVGVTLIDFDAGGPGAPEQVQWCLGNPTRVDDSDPTTIDPLAVDGAGAFIEPPVLPAGASWCLLDQVISYVGEVEVSPEEVFEPHIQLTEYYYGTEVDPFWERP